MYVLFLVLDSVRFSGETNMQRRIGVLLATTVLIFFVLAACRTAHRATRGRQAGGHKCSSGARASSPGIRSRQGGFSAHARRACDRGLLSAPVRTRRTPRLASQQGRWPPRRLSSPGRSRRRSRQCCMGHPDVAQRLDSRHSGGPGHAGRERVAWDLGGELHPGENAGGLENRVPPYQHASSRFWCGGGLPAANTGG